MGVWLLIHAGIKVKIAHNDVKYFFYKTAQK